MNMTVRDLGDCTLAIERLFDELEKRISELEGDIETANQRIEELEGELETARGEA